MKTTTDSLTSIREAFNAASGQWTGCDWTTSDGACEIDLDGNTADQVQAWHDALQALLDLDLSTLAESAEELDEEALLEVLADKVTDDLGMRSIPTVGFCEQNELGEDLPIRDRIEILQKDLASAIDWLKECEGGASAAESTAKKAVEAAESGDMETALKLIKEACSIESDYGDDPTWGPVLSAIEASL